MSRLSRLLPWCAALLLAVLLAPCSVRAGEVPGVVAEYYNYAGTDTPTFPTAIAYKRIESTINVVSLSTAPAPRVAADRYLVRYTGYVRIPTTGSYTFSVTADDGVKLYLDCNGDGSFSAAELLVNKWQEQVPTTYTASCSNTLTAGQRYAFRYEFYEAEVTATARFMWSGPASSPVGTTSTVIPASDGTMGLVAALSDTTAPTLSSATLLCGDATKLLLTFSEALASGPATTTSNYALSGGHTVTGATLSSDGTSVLLTVTPALTTSRTLTLNNLTDLAASPANTIAANTSSAVVYNSGYSSGLYGTYYDQNQTAGAFFTGNTVSRVDSTVNFAWGTSTPVSGIQSTNYSVRWTGAVLAPSTGTYTFSVTSDDGMALTLNGTLLTSLWVDGSYTTTATVALTAGTYVPITLEYYQGPRNSSINLQWKLPSSSSTVTIPSSQLFYCNSLALGSFAFAAGTVSSTCQSTDVTITARDTSGSTLTGYTGTVNLTTTTGHGNWAAGTSPSPSGTLVAGASDSGAATYTFTAADAGVVKLTLTNPLGESLQVGAVDTVFPASASTSTSISFTAASSTYAFVFTEDAAGKINGSDVAVAGRKHDYTVTLNRSNGASCGPATDYNGSYALKMWRTDAGLYSGVGSWTAPSVESPALTIPSSQPAASNITLTFTSGVASFNLVTTDIGRYQLNLLDSSRTFKSNIDLSGSSNALTVRPFTIVINQIKTSLKANPEGAFANNTAFTAAGSAFQATVSAYLWNSAADSGNDGVPDSSISYALATGGGLAPSFNSTVVLTKTNVTAGSIVNGNISGFTGGTRTVTDLAYTEVGAFTMNKSSVVTGFLGSGLALDALMFNGNTNASTSTTVGRFIPASFQIGTVTVTPRADISCASSPFTYLDENFSLSFTLKAVNAYGNVTTKYVSSGTASANYAKLGLTASALAFAGVSGSTNFTTANARLTVGTPAGSWSAGVATVTVTLMASRASSPDGPFTASFGIQPIDGDLVRMSAYDIDTSGDGINDHAKVADVTLRYGRLRLSNALGAQDRTLSLPLTAQYWNGSAFVTNTDDACTKVLTTAVNFGNHRKTLVASDTAASGSVTLSGGTGLLVLSKPASGHLGTVDVALSLGSTATDTSCLQTWTPSKAATAGAGLSYLRGDWCGSGSGAKDPSARASFGLYRGLDKLIFQRENY